METMNYQEAIAYIFNALPMFQRQGAAAYKANLDTSSALDLYDGQPHTEFATVHVAGTNGKGSVSHMMASVLQAAGYKTGLFTSPHMVDFRERIRINGENIPEDYAAEYVSSHLEVFEELKPSFFEMSAAMAFSYFRDSHVDIAVIEVGMGGRLDSTNIIHPEISIITNIGYDHMAFLGDTLGKIAREKCGIIKDGVPVIFGEVVKETANVFIETAKSHDALYEKAQDYLHLEEQEPLEHSQRLTYKRVRDGKRITVETDLMGAYQRHNVATVLTAIDILRMSGYRIPEQAEREGLAHAQASTHLYGRWQQLGHAPSIIADAGHNENGLKETLPRLVSLPAKTLRIVMAVVNDKDLAHILPLFPTAAVYYFASAQIPRALPWEELRREAEQYGLRGEGYESIERAVAAAVEDADREDVIFIGGSTYTVAEALPLFLQLE